MGEIEADQRDREEDRKCMCVLGGDAELFRGVMSWSADPSHAGFSPFGVASGSGW